MEALSVGVRMAVPLSAPAQFGFALRYCFVHTYVDLALHSYTVGFQERPPVLLRHPSIPLTYRLRRGSTPHVNQSINARYYAIRTSATPHAPTIYTEEKRFGFVHIYLYYCRSAATAVHGIEAASYSCRVSAGTPTSPQILVRRSDSRRAHHERDAPLSSPLSLRSAVEEPRERGG